MALDLHFVAVVAWTLMGLLALGALLATNAIASAEEHERIAVYRGDRVHRVGGPGLVLKWPFLEGVARIDMRHHKDTVELPAIAAGNGAWVAATLRVDHAVLQPEKAAEVARMRYLGAAIQELVEAAFREVASHLPPDQMVEARDRTQLGRSVKKVANETALAWGIDITSIEVAEIRAIAAPAEGAARRWQVVLADAGTQPIAVIRAIREATGLGLKEAKELLEAAPTVLPATFDVEVASRTRRLLEQAGARATFGLAADGEAGEAVGPAGASEGDTVDVMLRAPGERVIEVIKVLRRVTGWDLAHAKAVVEQAPYAIMHRVRRHDAEEVRRALEAAGATVELV